MPLKFQIKTLMIRCENFRIWSRHIRNIETKIRLPCASVVISTKILPRLRINILCCLWQIHTLKAKSRIFMSVYERRWMRILRFAVRWNMMVLLFLWPMKMENCFVPSLVEMEKRVMMWRIMWRRSALSHLYFMVTIILPLLRYVAKFSCLGRYLKSWIVKKKHVKSRYSLIQEMRLPVRWSFRTLLLWLLVSWMHICITCWEISFHVTDIMKIFRKLQNGDLKYLIWHVNVRHWKKYLILSIIGM